MKKKLIIKFFPLETDDKYSKREKEIINDFTEKFLVKEFEVEKNNSEEFEFTFSKEELYDEFDGTIITGIPNVLERWTINSDGIAALKDINLTQDFFGTHQLTIVNKKVFVLLKDRIPELLNRSVPIFRK